MLKLVELNPNTNGNNKNSSQLSLVSNSTLINNNSTLTSKQQNGHGHYLNTNEPSSIDVKSQQKALFNEYYSNSSTSAHLQNCQDQITKLQQHQQQLAQLPPMIPNHGYRYNITDANIEQQHQQQQQIQHFEQPTNGVVNPRSLSEPRHQVNLANRASMCQQHYAQLPSNFSYEPQAIDHHSNEANELYQSQHMNTSITSSVETYDNLNDHQLTHQSRIDSNKYFNNQNVATVLPQQVVPSQFDRYNATLRPHYNSMRLSNSHVVSERDIKSVDREILYNYYKLNQSKQEPQSSSSFNRNTPKRQSLQHQNIRDIKSCERDMAGMSSSSSSSHNTPISSNNKNGQVVRMLQSPSMKMAPLEPLTNDVNNRSRSGSVTPQQQQQQKHQYEAEDATEDDDLTCTSSSIYQYDLSNNNNGHQQNDVNENSTQDNETSECISNSNDLLDTLDENDIENYETSKIKMKLMQKQLADLTSLVNQALINKDLNQLAAQYGSQSMHAKNFNMTFSNNIHSQKNGTNRNSPATAAATSNLKVLNEKTKSLKNDLNSLKKLQENLNSSFGNSMKNFVQQLNVNLI